MHWWKHGNKIVIWQMLQKFKQISLEYFIYHPANRLYNCGLLPFILNVLPKKLKHKYWIFKCLKWNKILIYIPESHLQSIWKLKKFLFIYKIKSRTRSKPNVYKKTRGNVSFLRIFTLLSNLLPRLIT